MPTIALVDDDRNILTSVSIALEAEGYRIMTYTDGASALEGFKTSPPDLAILDIKMPRMDGMAAPKELDAKALERGALRTDPERHTCTWKNEPVTLTVTEFLILQALATRPGVVKSRNALMDAAYDDQVYVDDRTIDSHIKRLRKKFKAIDPEFNQIETLYGVGYRYRDG